jgi:hypothetical protein
MVDVRRLLFQAVQPLLRDVGMKSDVAYAPVQARLLMVVPFSGLDVFLIDGPAHFQGALQGKFRPANGIWDQ